jgi:hypothetical protein
MPALTAFASNAEPNSSSAQETRYHRPGKQPPIQVRRAVHESPRRRLCLRSGYDAIPFPILTGLGHVVGQCRPQRSAPCNTVLLCSDSCGNFLWSSRDLSDPDGQKNAQRCATCSFLHCPVCSSSTLGIFLFKILITTQSTSENRRLVFTFLDDSTTRPRFCRTAFSFRKTPAS